MKKTAAYSTCSITSMSALLGGFVVQEVVKFTGKYTPLKQWFHYDVSLTVTSTELQEDADMMTRSKSTDFICRISSKKLTGALIDLVVAKVILFQLLIIITF